MEELKDIQGLDQISNLPLAIGWWIIIGLASIALLVGLFFLYKRYVYRNSWQFKAYSQLQNLEQELEDNPHKKVLQDLSVELKHIAMQTQTREACAGLSGRLWLQWLKDHDPQSFDWTAQGQLLLQYQYMPGTTDYDVADLRKLITAAKAWVNKC